MKKEQNTKYKDKVGISTESLQRAWLAGTVRYFPILSLLLPLAIALVILKH